MKKNAKLGSNTLKIGFVFMSGPVFEKKTSARGGAVKSRACTSMVHTGPENSRHKDHMYGHIHLVIMMCSIHYKLLL